MPGAPGESIANALDLVAENDNTILRLEKELGDTNHKSLVASCSILGWLVSLRNTVKSVYPQSPKLRHFNKEFTRQHLDDVKVGSSLLGFFCLRV